MERASTFFDSTINSVHEMVFSAMQEQNECYTFKEMLQQEDKADFIDAMVKEVWDHETRDHWTIVDRATMPKGTCTILSIWSFKRKRFLNGQIMKHKARLCAHGGMQWGVDYWETYSPVVNWISIRALLAIAQIHSLPSRSIDFILAFPQADLKEDVYMELPVGMTLLTGDKKDKVLKLQKSLYGLKSAGKNWFDHLKGGLIRRGFKPSQIDPCVYMSETLVLLVYIDDVLIISRSEKDIEKFVHSMKNGPERYNFTDEGDISKYLGVDIVRNKDGSMELRQTYLIQRIIEKVGLVETTGTKETPVGKPLLHKDCNGVKRKQDWHYRSTIGMLSYLKRNI